jgi:hypothetical protein
MTSDSPEATGAIQARLAYLRLRKVALDDLILSLERYLVYDLSPLRTVQLRPAIGRGQPGGRRHLTGL